MALLERLKTFVTGKDNMERKQESAANRLIRQKANAAALREKQKQSIKFAEERERFMVSEKLKKLKQPPRSYPSISSGFGGGGMLNILGGPAPQPQKQKVRKKVTIPSKKKKKKKSKARYVYVNKPMPMSAPERFRVI